jgi:hypothetical protein
MEALIVNLKLMLVVHYVGELSSLPPLVVPRRCTLPIAAAPHASLYGYECVAELFDGRDLSPPFPY